MFPVIAMQIFDFKNSIIAIKLFLVMILNMHLTSEILHQNDLKVSLILWWQGLFEMSQWSYKTTPVLPCQKQLHSQ